MWGSEGAREALPLPALSCAPHACTWITRANSPAACMPVHPTPQWRRRAASSGSSMAQPRCLPRSARPSPGSRSWVRGRARGEGEQLAASQNLHGLPGRGTCLLHTCTLPIHFASPTHSTCPAADDPSWRSVTGEIEFEVRWVWPEGLVDREAVLMPA